MKRLNSTTLTEELDTLFNLSELFTEEGPSLINMAEEKTLKELDAPPVQQSPLCITAANLQALLELKSSLIHSLPKFRGLANEDPYNHFKEFHVVCSSMKPDKITEDHIKLRAFPFSLKDGAKKWLFYLLAGSITSWEQMMKTFLGRYYPASRVNNVRRKLFGIKQRTHETLFDYWERFKELCASCPQHGIPEQALINFFYEGLQPNARSSINGRLVVHLQKRHLLKLDDAPIILGRPFLATNNTLIDVGKGELTMRIQDPQVTFNMLNPIKSPKENKKSLKIEAAKEGESKAAIDGDLNNRQIDPGEKSQKYLTEIDATDQFGGLTMLKAPPWCNKSKSPHHINQELRFTPGVQKNLTGRDTRNWDSCKVTSTTNALIDPG
ncbi:uncharacterized protein G2W53_041222 [Senna tora]|uniref:Retrotransposon gag domain-containing protein n=1 Tax=Senna tora TaxID=362788 RepID=A0A834SER5_9FABA|nr:uncharacterized protein G2W53_041222 [Senna tora]